MLNNTTFRSQNRQIIGKIRGRGNLVAMETNSNHGNSDVYIPSYMVYPRCVIYKVWGLSDGWFLYCGDICCLFWVLLKIWMAAQIDQHRGNMKPLNFTGDPYIVYHLSLRHSECNPNMTFHYYVCHFMKRGEYHRSHLKQIMVAYWTSWMTKTGLERGY